MIRAQALHPDPQLVQLDCLAPDAQSITLVVTTRRATVPCPVCGRAAHRVHSRYQRTVADLPWNGVPVRLRLRSRRFFCDRAECPRAIFTERLPGLVARYARRTCQLAETLLLIGQALGGEAGAELATRLGLGAKPDTLLLQLRRAGSMAAPIPRVLGVDDFAWRKGVRYGTILVDLERSRPVDLLPDRRAETLAQWLKEHPGVEIVARDRSSAYAEGIRQGAPEAVQVADRWHLLKNLTEALEALLTREHRSLQQAAEPEAGLAAEQRAEGPSAPANPPGASLSSPALPGRSGRSRRENQEPALRRERRLARYEAVRRLFREGRGVREIAHHLAMSRTTVAKYVAAGSFPERKVRANPPTQLTPCAAYLERRWEEGCHNAAQLWRELREQGFRGGQVAVYRFTAAWRTARVLVPPRSVPPLPPPRKVLWWLLGEPEQLTADQQAFTLRLGEICPPVRIAVAQVREFFQLVRDRRSEALAAWVEATEQSGIGELQSFCKGVRGDWEAVLAGLTLSFSNGPTEGQVTRLKLIKRQMYGRAGFDLLRARVLARKKAT